MFERFTDRARRVIVLAQDASRDMGHAQIRPEHLLVGLQEGQGLAADTLTEAGVDGAALRERVAALYERPSAKKVNKVPFSTEGKKVLELSLREALRLGHSYIGTEHIFFGIRRQAAESGGTLDGLLGVSADAIASRLTEMLGGVTSGSSMLSPALGSTLERARARAGRRPMTTGHVLQEMVADADSQVARALGALGLDGDRVQAALQAVSLEGTSDASPVPQSITITIGESTTVIPDPDVAAALHQLTDDQLREVIKRVADNRNPVMPPDDEAG